MEASQRNQNNGASTKPKVVKVVQLNQFMPKMETNQVFKRKTCFNNFETHSPSDHTENVNLENKLFDDSIVKGENKQNENEMDIHSNVKDGSSSCKTKLIDNQTGKINFKEHCTHKLEELTKLTENYDETLVKVGNTFESREAFREYLNDNAKRWFYYYVCRTSTKRKLEYNCICMAYKLKPNENNMRRQKQRTTACPCKIRLAVDGDTKKVIVYYVCNHHDHDLTETAFYHYPHAKYLPQEIKDVFLDLAYLGLDIDLIQKYIHSLIGLTIKRKDISSYAYKFKRKMLQRDLTIERRKYIKDLITTIRCAYKETMDVTLQGYSEDDLQVALGTETTKNEQRKRRKSQGNSKEGGKNNSSDTTMDDDVNMNYKEPRDNILDNLLVPYVTFNNYDVIVQYINEEGILCDQNGTPVTNSSAVMQFITNYEYVMGESSVKDEFLEEGTVFSELVEHINDDIYPLDWDSVQETKAVNEKLDEVNKTSVDGTEDVTANSNVGATVDRDLGPGQDKNSNDTPRITVLSDIIVNCDKRLSPTRASPAVYAEMDNFKKYYFVDHQYIKYESENSNDQAQKATKETQLNCRESMIKVAVAHGKEYIKAPGLINLPSPLRKCYGHDSLMSLSDTDVILPGAKFLTHDVFVKYINERANRWFFYYSLVESGKVPEYYVYKCVYGKHRASKNAYRPKGLRKRTKLTTQCPCQIRLRRLYKEPTYLTVLYSCNHHDHALDAQLFKAQPHSRRLPEHVKEEIKDLLSLGATFDVLRKYVTSETGLRIYDKYFHNVRVKMAKDKESRQFTDERSAALWQKLKDLEATFGSASKENPFGISLGQPAKRQLSSQIQMEDQSVKVGFKQAATQTQEHYQLEKMDDIAQKVFIVQSDSSQTRSSRKHGRLERRLKNISSHEETLRKVKKLQESVRSDNLRYTYEIVQ